MIAPPTLSFSRQRSATRKNGPILVVGGLLVAALATPAASAPPSATPAPASPSAGSGGKPAAGSAKPASDAASAVPFGAKSKDPIYITSDRLDIYDKEGRAVYSGASGVVATQGASKLVGSELTAYYERQHENGGTTTGDSQAQPQGTAGTQVKRILVKGPVSVVQNDQVATGDNGEFDRVSNIVTLTGHVSLTQGADVTTGDKLIYDLNTGVANVFSAPGTPVKSLFVQGSQPGDAKPANAQKTPPGKPAPASTGSKPAAKPAAANTSSTKAASAKSVAPSPAKAAEP